MSANVCRFVLGIALLGFVPAATASPEDRFQITHLAPDLMMLSTDQGSYSNNSLIFTGPDGVLLVDTQHDQDRADFKDFVTGLGLGSPKYIISTHRHVEHIGGNDLFGPNPVIVAHELLPGKLRRGTFLFNEYPPESFPDVTFADSLEINFNGEVIRLADIGGSHDDNEIMVHFTKHRIAHISSVVNGFNFPSVDGDGDALNFPAVVHRLMTLLPHDVRLVSGHNGKAKGYDFCGTWDMLPAYADMMENCETIVRRGLAEGQTMADLQAAGALDQYAEYAGSYVDANGWIEYLVDALTVPKDLRDDVCQPIYQTWKQDGARAAVDCYAQILKSQSDLYSVNEYVLMSIGSKLYTRGLYSDAVEFLLGCTTIYPESAYGYYTHYLAAKCYQKQDQNDLAKQQCRESVRLNPDDGAAAKLLKELGGDK